MTVPWFHVAQIPDANAIVELDAREARHATGARRLGEGDMLCLFDGAGTVADGRIATWDDRRTLAVRIETRRVVPAPAPEIHLAVALPKGDHQSTLISMATQLGVASITPLLCTRGVAQPTEKFADRAMRVCLEACKQSRRAHLPRIGPPRVPSDVAAAPHAFIAHPGGISCSQAVATLAASAPAAITVLVGPEGGFTDDELAAARGAGATQLDLGPGVLRIETAAVAAIALLRLMVPID